MIIIIIYTHIQPNMYMKMYMQCIYLLHRNVLHILTCLYYLYQLSKIWVMPVSLNPFLTTFVLSFRYVIICTYNPCCIKWFHNRLYQINWSRFRISFIIVKLRRIPVNKTAFSNDPLCFCSHSNPLAVICAYN